MAAVVLDDIDLEDKIVTADALHTFKPPRGTSASAAASSFSR
jgi:hypothetical protein